MCSEKNLYHFIGMWYHSEAAKERFSLTKHLISATLLQGDLFPQHSGKSLDSELETTVEAHLTLDEATLKTELSLVCENEEFKACSGALALVQVFMKKHPPGHIYWDCMSSLDSHHHTDDYSRIREVLLYLKRIKTFLRNTMNARYHLNTLALHGEKADTEHSWLKHQSHWEVCHSERQKSKVYVQIRAVTHSLTYLLIHTHTHTHTLTHSITHKKTHKSAFAHSSWYNLYSFFSVLIFNHYPLVNVSQEL